MAKDAAPKGLAELTVCLQIYEGSLQVGFLRLQSQWVVAHRDCGCMVSGLEALEWLSDDED